MNKTKENVVIIFAKRPKLGKTKSRVALETSSCFALKLTLACFSDLLSKTRGSFSYDLIVGADNLEDISWFEKNYHLEGFLVKPNKAIKTQSDKFHYIFSSLLGPKELNYSKAILIPMDLPYITEEDLVTAFSRLNHYHFVHGPETNGGIYLVGISAPYSQNIFRNVRWSTPYSFEDLLLASNKADGATYKLKYRTDLNTFQDILQARQEITHNCPNLYSLLEKNGYYLPDSGRYVDYNSLSICIPVVSALVEKESKKGIELLIQTRYKPTIDRNHTGLIEIPSGLIQRFQPIEEEVVREVEEETGIECVVMDFEREASAVELGGGSELAVAFRPFWCGQQLKGTRSYLNIVFLCQYVTGEPEGNYMETKNPRWISLKKLKGIVVKTPHKIFSLHLPILRQYLKYRKIVDS